MPPELREVAQSHSDAQTCASLKWAKPAADISADFCGEWLKFAASGLRAQAEMLESLASCRDLGDTWKVQHAFFESCLELYLSSARRALRVNSDGLSAAQQ